MRIRNIPLLILFCLSIFGQSLNAQYYFENGRFLENNVTFEIGSSWGLMSSLTDLNGRKARSCFGIYVATIFKDAIVTRLEGTFGQVNGYDSVSGNVSGAVLSRSVRNLSFKSRISEIQFAIEVHPLLFKYYDNKEPPRISPYGLASIGYFSFDPQAELNGKWYSLQPLHTEGQGFKEYPDRNEYKLSQINFGLGGGFKYEISSSMNARLEVEYRILKTDYLDDVSTNYIDPNLFNVYLPSSLASVAQKLANRTGEINPGSNIGPGDIRGNPKYNDAYFTIQLKLGIILGRQRR